MVFDTEKYSDSSEFESNINHLAETWDYVYVSQFYKAVNGVKPLCLILNFSNICKCIIRFEGT